MVVRSRKRFFAGERSTVRQTFSVDTFLFSQILQTSHTVFPKHVHDCFSITRTRLRRVSRQTSPVRSLSDMMFKTGTMAFQTRRTTALVKYLWNFRQIVFEQYHFTPVLGGNLPSFSARSKRDTGSSVFDEFRQYSVDWPECFFVFNNNNYRIYRQSRVNIEPRIGTISLYVNVAFIASLGVQVYKYIHGPA